MKNITDKLIEEAIVAAKNVAKNAYAPYSKFSVGAALVTVSQKIYVGCNFENAAIGETICAERSAVASAIAHEGKSEFPLVVVYTPTSEPTTPCGACRQVLNEFNPEMMVISVCDGKDELRIALSDLLPRSFGPANLAGI